MVSLAGVDADKMSHNIYQMRPVSYTWQILQRYPLNYSHGAHYAVERAPPGSMIFTVHEQQERFKALWKYE